MGGQGGKRTGVRRSAAVLAKKEAGKNLTNPDVYSTFCMERNNRNDRYY